MNEYNFKLLNQLLEESEVMAQHALGSGMRVPDQIMEDLVCSRELLSKCRKLCENDESQDAPEPGSEENDESQDASEQRDVKKECMDLTKNLARIHGQLAQIVEPALPQTLRLIHEQKVKNGRWGNFKKKLGSVPLVQNMVIAALFSLAGFFIFSGFASALAPAVGSVNEVDGTTKFFVTVVNLLILLCAAGMGASYNALYQANRLVVDGTYDVKYNSSYWIRFVLGLISGVILAEVISQSSMIPQQNDELQQFGKIVLALLGGFSASVVYRILTRLVEAVESIFLGDESEKFEAKEQAAKAKLEEQNAQERLQIGAELMQLSQKIGPDLDETKAEINKIFDKLMPFDTEST